VEPSSAPWRIVEPEPDDAPSPDTPESGRDLPWVAIGAVIIALVVAVSGLLLATRPSPGIEVDGAVTVEAGSAAEGGSGAADPATPAADVVVEVGGAVVRPGVYRLAPGSRVLDAVDAAGGFGPRVDAAEADRRLNLASPVKDGDEIHVPARGEVASQPGAGGAGGAGAAGTGSGGGPIDINQATADQLDTLPGIGPATAAKIIAARAEQPFASIDDLGARKVVGPATLEKIRALVTVGP
jgi:competence protein ComEA